MKKKILLVLVLVLVVLFVAGCMQDSPICTKPYIIVGNDCCLDENSDGICDKDKPVCKKPYILVGNGCCLDSNSDGVCDRDQATTTTVTTTTTVKQKVTTSSLVMSTTTFESSPSECSTIYDCSIIDDLNCDDLGRVVTVHYTPIRCSVGRCIYRSSKEMSAYPCGHWETCVNDKGCVRTSEITTTSTTLTRLNTTISPEFQKILDRVAERARVLSQAMSTTTTTLVPCYDSDGGLKFNIQSLNVSGHYAYNETFVTDAFEFCQSYDKLIEYYCESNVLKSRVKECGNQCVDGRCCEAEGNLCGLDRDCCSGSCVIIGMTNHCVSK